jgi:hypothetical protein
MQSLIGPIQELGLVSLHVVRFQESLAALSRIWQPVSSIAIQLGQLRIPSFVARRKKYVNFIKNMPNF